MDGTSLGGLSTRLKFDNFVWRFPSATVSLVVKMRGRSPTAGDRRCERRAVGSRGATRPNDDTGGGETGLFCRRDDRNGLEGSVELIETLLSGERHLVHCIGSWRFVEDVRPELIGDLLNNGDQSSRMCPRHDGGYAGLDLPDGYGDGVGLLVSQLECEAAEQTTRETLRREFATRKRPILAAIPRNVISDQGYQRARRAQFPWTFTHSVGIQLTEFVSAVQDEVLLRWKVVVHGLIGNISSASNIGYRYCVVSTLGEQAGSDIGDALPLLRPLPLSKRRCVFHLCIVTLMIVHIKYLSRYILEIH